MKPSDLLILAAAAGFAWWMVKGTLPKLGAGRGAGYVDEVTPGGILPGQPGYGWRYFEDGTAIDPAGNYYSGGVVVWSPR